MASKVSRIWRSVSRMRPLSSRSAVSRSSRWRSSSSTCASASSYSALASGLTGPSCSRRRCRRSMRARRPSAVSGSSGSEAGCASRPSRAASASSSCGGVVLGVADLLGADLGRGDRVAALAQARLDLGLLGGARAQRAGHALPRLAVGQQLGVERLDARGDASERGRERRDQAVGDRQQRPVAHQGGRQALDARGALGALARGPLGHAALGGELALDLRAAHGRLALVGRLAALVDEPRRAALLLDGLRPGAVGVAQGAIGLVARRVGRLHGRRRRPRRRPARPARPARRARTRSRARRGGCARPARAPSRRAAPGAARG